ncbi:MAG: amino acid adenylation domain-containing protein, partial [Methylococcales bacterium]|nr:amino acid adenylation domain-containing protein [Methylococcales bacterium]
MTLISAFNKQCELTPDKIAFLEGEQQFNYLQLQQHVNLLSSQLLANEKTCRRIVIALDRGIDAAIAILAVLNAGACYIPLDLKNPGSRLNYIVNDTDAQFVIGKGDCPDWLDNSVLWLDISALNFSATLDTTTACPVKQVDPEALAAILYTSGSTGNPKGVALSHRAMLNFSDWAADTFNITDKDQIASLAPFHFDLSVFDLFSSLNCGATVHFVPSALVLSPSRLTAWLNEHKISLWYTVPSLLSFIALKGNLSNTPLPHLKTILFAGEVFPTPQLIKLCHLLPKIDFYNLYGPTETNVCCYWPIDRNRLSDDQSIPIGHPACDSVLIIDNKTGELSVKSANNLSGYWQQGKLISALSTEHYYHTGDKVSVNQHGEYCYHGRLDRMLKCSGYRVEPAEIEQAILKCAEVENCAVVGIKDSTSGQRPAAAIILKANASLTDIIKPLRQKLPAYMQPCKFIVLKSIPYLANGKTDY